MVLNRSLQQWLDDTLAILVLYKIPLNSSDAFISLTASLKANDASLDLFVYDNSPTTHLSPPINQSWRITNVHDPANPGVSKAYNEGFKNAKQSGKKWLLLLDQDTIFPNNAIERYHAALVTHPNQSCFVPQLVDRIGIISPFKFRLGNGFRINSVSKGIHSISKLQFINSGMMIRLNGFEKAKGFNEKLKLDFSDLAFISRLKRNLSKFVVVDLTVNHSLSGSIKKNLQEDLERFMLYSNSAIEFKQSEMRGLSLPLCIIPHALRLCVHHGTLIFLKEAVRTLAKKYAP